MYKPQQPSIPKSLKKNVLYIERTAEPSKQDLIFCYWELKTTKHLSTDFQYLILPDACVDIVFDVSPQHGFEGALIMTPHNAVTTVNLGTSFSYIGIRLLPGAWLKTPQDIIGEMTYFKKLANTDLAKLQVNLSKAKSAADIDVFLDAFVQDCRDQNIIGKNALAQMILKNIDTITSVNDILDQTSYSRRHFQRIFKEEIGYSPHDFLKILRFQQAIAEKENHWYTDQSHYIKEFKRITGMTPGSYWKKF